MQYAPFDMHDFLARAKNFQEGILTTLQIKDMIFQILMALDTLHSANIVHRDIKPANILMNYRGKVFLADLGIARSCSYRMMRKSTYVQTTWYKAPELLCQHPKYLCAVDVWSVGCMMFEMLAKKAQPGLFGETEEEHFDNIFDFFEPEEKEADRFFPSFTTEKVFYFSKKLQEELRILDDLDMIDLLLRLLTVDPSERITAREALFHPFFKDVLEGEFVLGQELQTQPPS